MSEGNDKKEAPIAYSKREIDPELWDAVKELSEGTSTDRRKCIDIILNNYYKLPKEVEVILVRFASSEEDANRIHLAKLVVSKPHITFGLYLRLIEVLTEDENTEIQELLEEEIKEKRELIASFAGPMTELLRTLQSVRDSYSSLAYTLPLYPLKRPPIPHIPVPRITIPVVNIPREVVLQMVELGKVNQEMMRGIANLTSGYFTLNEIKSTYEIEEPEENPLIEKLKDCPPGIENWNLYQGTVREILEETLVPPLAPSSEESGTETGAQRRDIILPIPYDTSHFWNWIRISHSSIGVIVDTKNYSDELPGNQVVVFSKYLGERRIGLFGIIATRMGFDENARKEQARLWRDEGKMIVCLNDEDLKRMIALKEAGETPEIIIDEKIRGLRESLE